MNRVQHSLNIHHAYQTPLFFERLLFWLSELWLQLTISNILVVTPERVVFHFQLIVTISDILIITLLMHHQISHNIKNMIVFHALGIMIVGFVAQLLHRVNTNVASKFSCTDIHVHSKFQFFTRILRKISNNQILMRNPDILKKFQWFWFGDTCECLLNNMSKLELNQVKVLVVKLTFHLPC